MKCETKVYFMERGKQKIISEFEKCVVCGKNTGISTDRNVHTRKHYVYGGGQLCEKCYEDLYSEWKQFRIRDKRRERKGR